MKQQWWQPTVWMAYLREHRLVSLGLVAVVILGGVAIRLAWPEAHTIQVTGLDNAITIRTHKAQLGAALTEHGIQVGAKDEADPPLETSLKGKAEVAVTIKKAFPVTVTIRGESQMVETTAATVEELLTELNVTLEPNDHVTAEPKAELTSGMEVRVVHRTEEVRVTQEEIPYDLVRQDDRSMVIGETLELQAGEPGILETREVVHYEDGKEVGSEIIEERVAKEPVNQIVAYGTLGVVSRGGRDYRYTESLEMSSTGYTAGPESNPNGNGYTYTGMLAQRGVVAVDPSVIPLYTRLYIEGYGPAVAGDVGGAIQGNKIDLCFDTLEEALSWGRRPVTVYVLHE